MIQVLIATANLPIIEENTFAKLKVRQETQNTSHFWISEQAFQNLYKRLKDKGYNPFALMYW